MKKGASRRKGKNTSGVTARRIKAIVDILVQLIGLVTVSIHLYLAVTAKAPALGEALIALRVFQLA